MGIPFERIDECRLRIPRSAVPGMRVDGIIYADERLTANLINDRSAEQVANVAHLPGIVRASYAMPDIHWGYGFCIGGVAATDVAAGGFVSPGGVGYDINCGVRLVRTDLAADEVRRVARKLVDTLFASVPSGVGVGGKLKLKGADERRVLTEGAAAAVALGFGRAEDVAHTEAGGCLPDANPDGVSPRACRRGADQCGTLGSGNHFVEVQVVDKVYDAQAARAMRVAEGLVTVMIHSGSRGLGHQVCGDYLKRLASAPGKYGARLPDRQLAGAPVDSDEGKAYLGAMRAAANYAWANRQMLMHHVRQAFAKVFGRDDEALGMALVYDVAHNIAKIEQHEVEGRTLTLCVHRKGATRAFGPGHPELPERYRATGQPVIIPGDMGRASYLLAGTERAMTETFGTTCHGAGRMMSRKAAIRAASGRSIEKELAARGVTARAASRTSLAEEQPDAYKDVNTVVDVVVKAGLSKRVARMRPICVIKG